MLPRFLQERLVAVLTDTPVACVVGPRRAGKTTLATAAAAGRPVMTLDDLAPRTAAQADPEGWLRQAGTRAVIDEVQRVPELLLAIKAAVDRDPSPGRYVLTGSADVRSLPQVADSLVGRMEVLTLWPLSPAERDGSTRPSFVDDVFGAGHVGHDVGTVAASDLVDLVLRGGFPEALLRDDPVRRRDWFDTYIDGLVQRDLPQISNLQHHRALPVLISSIAAAAPGVVNLSRLSATTGIPRTSLDRYMAVLEQAFVVCRVPAWRGNVALQQIRSARTCMADTGLMAHVLGASSNSLQGWGRATLGALVENLVLMELVRQSAWSERRPRVFHWRTSRGAEVDAVLQDRDGRIAGIEVKLSEGIVARDARHLAALRDASGERWARGVVLHAGSQVTPLGAQIEAWPIDWLWS